MTTRRSFIASILAAGVAPAAVGSSILMPVKRIAVPSRDLLSVMQPRLAQLEEYAYAEFMHAKLQAIAQSLGFNYQMLALEFE